jgi:hypothetical protein
MSDDDDRIPECDYCGDECGLCDRPHLVDGRCFSIKLDETYDVETVRNDKSFFVIKHDFCFFNV